MKKIFILIIVSLLLSGCFDYHELINMQIVSTILIDYVDDEYIVNLEIVQSSKEENEINTKILNGRGKNLSDAFYNLNNISNGKLFYKHVKVVILSKNVINSKLTEAINYLLRNNEVNSNYSLLSCDSIDGLINYDTDNDYLGNIITEKLSNIYQTGNSFTLDIVSKNIIENKTFTLPSFDVDNDNIIINKVSIFNGNKYIKNEANNIYNFLLFNKINTDFKYGNNVIEVYDKKIKYIIDKNKIKINIDCLGQIKMIDSNYNLNKNSDYNYLNNKFNSVIKNEVNKFLISNNDYDILNLKSMYYKKYKIKKDNIKIIVNVNLTINRNGQLYEVIYD